MMSSHIEEFITEKMVIPENSIVLLTPDSTPTKASSDEVGSSSECEENLKNHLCHSKQIPNGEQVSDTSPSSSDIEECIMSATDSQRGLVRSQSDTILDSPKPSKAKVVRSCRQTTIPDTSSGPPPPGVLKNANTVAKPPRRKRATKPKTSKKTTAAAASQNAKTPKQKDTKEPTVTDISSCQNDKRRSRSVPAKGKKTENNKLMTDFFPVRRSSRVPKSKLKEQNERELERCVLSNCADGLKVVDILGKGRGVVADKPFSRGDFVVEYHGELISLDEAKSLEQHYSARPDVGCYMYYFRFGNKSYCIDATAESGRLGRLLNHSKLEANCKTKVIGIGAQPYLILVASREIKVGEELLYDYGDRSKESLTAHPWLAL